MGLDKTEFSAADGTVEDQWRNDYYCTNAIDQAALVQELRYLGNSEAELIVTAEKATGESGTKRRASTSRVNVSPHFRTIEDERDLADWIERHMCSSGAKQVGR